MNQSNLIPVLLDVTDPIQIQQTLDTVSHHLNDQLPFIGIVNAASIPFMAPIELVSNGDWMHVFHVNTIGPFSVIQAFLPLLRESQGRIINVSSVSGLTASPMNGAYAASKMVNLCIIILINFILGIGSSYRCTSCRSIPMGNFSLVD